MSSYNIRSMVLIAPVQAIRSISEMAGALGYKSGFSIPLSSTGTGNATHLGLHATAHRYFYWMVTGQPETPPDIPDEPEPLTEEQLEAAATQEAELSFPDDPESETYQDDITAYYDALTQIRAPANAYRSAVREREALLKQAEALSADLAIYNAHMQGLANAEIDPAQIDALRAMIISSADPEVEGPALYGRAHVDYVAELHGLQVIDIENEG